MKNKLLRLIEIIQDDFPEVILSSFKGKKPLSLDEGIALISVVRDFHQNRADTLWFEADKMRSPEEKRATAQAELARFIIAYLTGEAKEYTTSATEALITLGRQGDLDAINNLTR
ncbi:MAG: hypothetical protein U9R29_08350 [Thermodesulfobacteriota bacterium]|nr:hypothetical protein [Thermodesulfobacteriota bacterium]